MSIVTMVSIIAEAVAIMATLASGAFFIGSLNTRVKTLEKCADENTAEHKAISDVTYDTQRKVAGLEATIESIKEVVYRIDDKIDRIMEAK